MKTTEPIDPAPGVDQPLLMAACGCTFRGRFYSTRGCTVLDQASTTGSRLTRHALHAKLRATPVVAA